MGQGKKIWESPDYQADTDPRPRAWVVRCVSSVDRAQGVIKAPGPLKVKCISALAPADARAPFASHSPGSDTEPLDERLLEPFSSSSYG